MKRPLLIILAATVGLLASGCAKRPSPGPGEDTGIASLTGAWRGKVQFTSGAFAAVKDLEFMYVFNVGGTMTESSNYDFASPPSPPAYGIWRKVGPGQYEAKYSCFLAKAPAGMEDLAKSGWPPGGYADLVEKITITED